MNATVPQKTRVRDVMKFEANIIEQNAQKSAQTSIPETNEVLNEWHPLNGPFPSD